MRRVLLMILAALALAPGSAFAVEPGETVAGAGSNWFSGSLIQQPGTNCATAILGSAYPEIMVSGVGSYGGAAGGGLVNVGEGYYTSLLTAVPGNPCGSGVSVIATDVLLPPGTTVDTSRPIRCFGLPINQNAWVELTGQTWSHLGYSGPWCPTQVSPSIYVQGGVSAGYRPQASGQMFQIFLPVVTNQTLVGMGDTTHAFRWATTATGVYANPGLSTVWANVLPASSSGQAPYVYFAREPAAQPFWKADAPAAPQDLRNRAEFWANFYTAGKAGVVSYQIHRTDSMALVWDSATQDLSFNGNVGAGQDLVQVLPTGSAVGPNGGYVPVAFDFPAEWDVPMRITWKFDPTGADPAVSNFAAFRTLSGPDDDGDGVANASDVCPTVKGTLANGCLPALVEDPDKDGVFGSADKCPTVDGKGSLDGCPAPLPASPPPPPPAANPTATPPPALGSILNVRAGAALVRAALAKGLSVSVTCTRNARATLSLRLTKRMATRLGLASPKAGLVVATGAGSCTAGVPLKLRLMFKKAFRARLARRGATVPATLTTLLVTADGTRKESKLAVKLR